MWSVPRNLSGNPQIQNHYLGELHKKWQHKFDSSIATKKYTSCTQTQQAVFLKLGWGSGAATWWIAKYRKPRTTVNTDVCITAHIFSYSSNRTHFKVHKVQGLDNALVQFESLSKNLRFCKYFIINTIIPRILLFLPIVTSCCTLRLSPL